MASATQQVPGSNRARNNALVLTCGLRALYPPESDGARIEALVCKGQSQSPKTMLAFGADATEKLPKIKTTTIHKISVTQKKPRVKTADGSRAAKPKHRLVR